MPHVPVLGFLALGGIAAAIAMARMIKRTARPATVRRVLTLPPGRPRAPNAPGVADAEQTILEELGLS